MKQDADLFVEYFKKRFGVRVSLWEPFDIDVGEKTVYLKTEFSPGGWEVKASGFRVARLTSKYFKPSNRFLQRLDDEIKESLITPDIEQFKKLIVDRKEIVMSAVDLERGYVAIKFNGHVAGCGFWTGDRLRTQVSKGLCSQFPDRLLAEF